MHYVKLWSSQLNGSLRKNPRARHILNDLCLIATARGEVDMTYDAIAGATGVPEEEIREAIAFLEQEDPDSRRSEEGGRRLVRLDPNRSWGWRIVNFEYYRGLRTQDHGTSSAERMARKRARDRGEDVTSPPVTRDAPTVTQRHVPPGSRQKAVGNRQEEPSLALVPQRDSEPLRTTSGAAAELPLGLPGDRVVETLALRGGCVHVVTVAAAQRLAEKFPRLVISEELHAAGEWLLANPRRLKTKDGIDRYINGWLRRSHLALPQERGARAAPRARDGPTAPVVDVGRDAISEHLAQKGDD